MQIKKSSFLVISLICIIILLFALSTEIFAVSNRAASLAHPDLSQHAQYASQVYSNMGYTSNFVQSPSKMTTRSNLISSAVIFAAGHGNNLSINLGNGIISCSSTVSSNAIDINSINWNNYGTKLITYLGSNTAGMSQNDPNSLTAKTASAGVEVAVGFKDSFSIQSGLTWSQRYNQS